MCNGMMSLAQSVIFHTDLSFWESFAPSLDCRYTDSVFPIHHTHSTVNVMLIHRFVCEETNNTVSLFWSIHAHSDIAFGTCYRHLIEVSADTKVCLACQRSYHHPCACPWLWLCPWKCWVVAHFYLTQIYRIWADCYCRLLLWHSGLIVQGSEKQAARSLDEGNDLTSWQCAAVYSGHDIATFYKIWMGGPRAPSL